VFERTLNSLYPPHPPTPPMQDDVFGNPFSSSPAAAPAAAVVTPYEGMRPRVYRDLTSIPHPPPKK